MKKSNKIKVVKSQKGLPKDLTTKVNASIEKYNETATPEKTIANNNNLFTGKNILKRDYRLPAVGTIIKRQYKGQHIEVKVLENGFEYEGKVFKSISRVAMTIVKRQISGYVFFGLTK